MATSQVENVGSGVEKLKLVLAIALVFGAITAFYLLSRQGQIAQWGALVVGIAAAVGVFLISDAGRQFIGFARDAYREVKKVVWPTRKEAIQITAYVFGFVIVMSIFLWVTDKTLEWLFYDVILGWRK